MKELIYKKVIVKTAMDAQRTDRMRVESYKIIRTVPSFS